MKIERLDANNIEEILDLVSQLNPEMDRSLLRTRQMEMFRIDHYSCFGLFDNNRLIGLSSAWTTVRLYSGKQLELDNVIIDSSLQSKGLGTEFMRLIESWAKENNYETIELNSYVHNTGSHKFYYRHNYKILGFHFQKKLRD